jgi:protein-L-isoaspartate(D-aspartate) O-methyltransferase
MAVAEELRGRYVDALRREGAITRPEVAAAFAAVPREAFVASGFHGRDGGWVAADGDGFLDAVYTNDVLVTKVVDGTPVSSSSQPSLMAAMIEALDLAPGMSVLEVGAGTGYNAALMAAVGARVTTIDVQPDVLARARAGIARAGVSDVELHEGDGYEGVPGRYERVVVTVGINGVSPQWFDQLAPGGFVLAPVAHTGHHPVLRVTPDGKAHGVCAAGFMAAAGPLGAAYPWMHPQPAGQLPDPVLMLPPRFEPPLDVFRYHDLCFACGVWDSRATLAQRGDSTACAVLDETGAAGAAVGSDGAVGGSGAHAEEFAARTAALLDRWQAAGEPAVAAWWADLALAGDPDRPIWVPKEWRLGDHQVS